MISDALLGHHSPLYYYTIEVQTVTAKIYHLHNETENVACCYMQQVLLCRLYGTNFLTWCSCMWMHVKAASGACLAWISKRRCLSIHSIRVRQLHAEHLAEGHTGYRHLDHVWFELATPLDCYSNDLPRPQDKTSSHYDIAWLFVTWIMLVA